jgi:hypothetical protein
MERLSEGDLAADEDVRTPRSPSGFAPYASARLGELRRTLEGVCSRVESDRVASAMKGDAASSAHVSSRVSEILERSLTHEREQRIAELVAELAVRDARVAQLERDLREARAAAERRTRELSGMAPRP